MAATRRVLVGIVLVTGLVIGAILPAAAQDWPQWRGPTRDGAVAALGAPPSWPERLQRRWQVEVGLGYESRLSPLRPEVSVGGQTSQTSKLRWVRLFVKLFESLGMRLGTDKTDKFVVPFMMTTDTAGQATPLFTGDKELSHTAWDCGVITIVQDQPLPSTVLMVGGLVDLGGS